MLEVQGTGVKISRGDTARIVIELDTAPAEGTRALVTLKRRPGMEHEALWEKELAVDGKQFTLDLNSEDTNHKPGVYWWDVRLMGTAEDERALVQTVFLPSPFEVVEVVGRA